jgi:hypothetical protein
MHLKSRRVSGGLAPVRKIAPLLQDEEYLPLAGLIA